MKVYTANITVSGSPSPRAIWQEKTPRTVLQDYREKFSTHKILKQAVDIHKGN